VEGRTTPAARDTPQHSNIPYHSIITYKNMEETQRATAVARRLGTKSDNLSHPSPPTALYGPEPGEHGITLPPLSTDHQRHKTTHAGPTPHTRTKPDYR